MNIKTKSRPIEHNDQLQNVDDGDIVVEHKSDTIFVVDNRLKANDINTDRGKLILGCQIVGPKKVHYI